MTHSKRTTRSTSGFTLAEVMVGIFIVFLLMGLTLVSFRAAANGARRVSDRALVHGLKIAVDDFSREFGMVPPLVKDIGSDASNPYPIVSVDGLPLPAVYSPAFSRDLAVLRGEDDEFPRFSTYSLAYYLVGALDASVDGVDGPGFVEVRRGGNFAPVLAPDSLPGQGGEVELARRGPKKYEPLFDTDRGSVELYIDTANRLTLSDGSGTLSRERIVYRAEIRDRRATALRYYRWYSDEIKLADIPGGLNAYTDTASDFSGSVSGLIAYLNIPKIVLDSYGDPLSPDFEVPIEVRGATYAVVGAGPNRLFGDHIDESLLSSDVALQKQYAEGLGLSVSRLDSDADYRQKAIEAARADNIVEVGS
jgi:competence protein ComGC